MKRIYKLTGLFVCLLTAFTLLVSASSVYNTSDDPLVSLSYVNEVLRPQIIQEVLSEVEAAYFSSANPGDTATSTYEVISMTRGQTFMAAGPCEIAMTMGNATIIITSDVNIQNGIGMNDLTASCRLLNGTSLPKDHYVIIPRGDGRGFKVTSETAFFMVRGEYNITG